MYKAIKNTLLFLLLATMSCAVAGGSDTLDLTLATDDYVNADLFTNPVLPREGEQVRIGVRLTAADVTDPLTVLLQIEDSQGQVLDTAQLELQAEENSQDRVAFYTWTAGANGFYQVTATVDPDNAIAETNEDNNIATLTLPVLDEGRELHFVWYRETPGMRWATCVTSLADEQAPVLLERGITPLKWTWGGMSQCASGYYDRELMESDPERFAAELEDYFYEMYTAEQSDGYSGFGIDEMGGYPGSLKEEFSAISLRGLVRAQQEMPERVFAVWHGGGVRNEVAQYYRQAADFLLLECYIWGAMPECLDTQQIYRMIDSRMEPYIRATDLITSAYSSHCNTLLAFDLSERPDYMEPGEMEQVIRYVRRNWPEMRGLCWYSLGAGYGRWGLDPTPELDVKYATIVATANDLLLRYYIMPCVTLEEESLWIDHSEGQPRLWAAVSNIGGMDSGSITVGFYCDGEELAQQQVVSVPAGANRNRNRVMVPCSVQLPQGNHEFEARILSADAATVLDSRATIARLIP